MKINQVRITSLMCTSLVGVDILQFSGLRLTLLPLLLYSMYILYKTKSVDKWFFYALSFAALSLPSVMFSENEGKSFGYIIWIVFNYLSISYVFKYIFIKDKDNVILGLRDSYRLQIILGAFLVFSGVQDRASALYYEASYFALSLTPYVVITLSTYIKSTSTVEHIKYTSLIDVLLLLVALYTTKSANLLLICILSVSLLSLFGKGKTKKIAVMFILSLAAASALYIYSITSEDLIARTINTILTSNNKFEALTDRTGNRWPRAMLTYDVAMNNFFGVGIGAFEEYTIAHRFPRYSWMPWYLSPIGYPPVNIYFEIAATCGWLALIFWLYWHYRLIKNANKSSFGNPIIVCSLVVAMVALFIESSFMRPYYWMLLGLAMGQISIHKKQLEKKRM